MKTTIEWLDALKEHLGLPSDYATAKALGVTRSTVSGYRTGRSVFDQATCIKVAELMGVDPFEIIASINAETARDSKTKFIWTNALEKFSLGFPSLALRANARPDWFLRV